MGNLFSKSPAPTVGNKRSLSDDDYDEQLKKKSRLSDPEMLVKEQDVGIVAFVNPHLKGFHSILKYRAEDFLVNEVDMEKNIIYLTSLDPPNTQTKEKLEIYPADVFDEKVAAVLGSEFATRFRTFLNNPEDKTATMTQVVDKDTRLAFYNLVNNHSDENVVCRSKNGELVIAWKTSSPQDEYINWKALGGDYLQVHMAKTNIDTMNAINVISKKASVQSKLIGYAGTKDARAITTQLLTFKSVKPGRLIAVQEELKKSQIYLGNFKFVPQGLTLGDLGGNHFTIVLRDVQGIDENELQASLESLQQNGFLNYFGMQRFGTSSVLTHTIGVAIMKKNYEEASNLILNPRDGDRQEYHVARVLWKETQDAEKALAIFPKRAFAERKLLGFYAKHSLRHDKAIKSLPKNMLSLYSHAYQSYIWNRVVSERVLLFGSNAPLVGDIVLVDSLENNQVSHNDVGRRNYNARKMPYILKKEDLQKYTIEDVVYPLPGKKTVYPENEVKELYKKFMAEDGISIERKSDHFSDLAGDYRHMLSKPEQMKWSFIRYNDPNEQLCNTDMDRIEQKPEPVGVPGGAFLALKVEFTLGTSQYATMALREIMRAETSSQVQSTLSHN